MDDFEIHFRNKEGSLSRYMFVVRKGYRGTEALGPDFETVTTYSVGEAIPATATIPPDVYDAMVKFFLTHHKPVNATFVEGKLEATEDHLADLRHLLKLPKAEVINVEAK